ncbi:hypothetical protein B0H19DRAFT_1276130 [Mycena capillaripes]|nr:hypothetical protein B0H19DRAFT_1276130 [Mycena capillaripes]
MPVAEFLTVQLPYVLDDDAPFPKESSSWFSVELPNCGEDIVWTLGSIPPLDLVRQLENDISQAWLDGAQSSIVDHTEPTRRLPLWNLTFFRKIIELLAAQKVWKESDAWLPEAEKYLLNFVSWNTKHTVASGGIMDEIMRDIKSCVSENPPLVSTTLIAPLTFQFYITQLGIYGTETKYLDEIVAEIKSGKTLMFSTTTTTIGSHS